MRKIIIAIILVCAGYMANAQQMPQYSQYLFNNFVMNPAVAGTHHYYDASSNHRYQWLGITDAPRTYVFSLNGPFAPHDKMGIGGYLFTDITGPTRRTGIQASWAYHLEVSESKRLSFGLSGGLLQFMVDGAKINLENKNDIALSDGVQSLLMPDAGAGLYFYDLEQKFFVSFSAPQLIPSKVQFFDDYPSTSSKLVNHFFLSGGYNFDVTDDFTIAPSALFKKVAPVGLQIEGTVRAIYQDQIWAGFSYRTSDAMVLMVGYTYQNNLTLGYAYDMTTSNIKNYSTGTHELMISIKFKNRITKSSAKDTSAE